MHDDHTTTEMELTNEFALVRVRKVLTRNGVRLEIASPRLGYSIRLDPLALESLTWQTSETFTRFLEDPYGPGHGGTSSADAHVSSQPTDDRMAAR